MRPKKTRLKIKAVKLATQKKLAKEPRCTFCPRPANTCHHFIRQSRSNYLRCDERNLIPICTECHCRLHAGYESLMTLELVDIFGEDWKKGLQRDANKMIKDTVKYWEDMICELSKE